MSIDLSPLVSNLKSATCSKQVSKTVIFCCTKDSCYSVYKHLWKNVVSSKRDWFGIYHASMSEAGNHQEHQERFKQSHMCVMIATTAFSLGVDVSDIASVILYGCPPDGLTCSQLSGCGGRNHDLICKRLLLLYSPGELKDVDHFMQTACSEEICLRDLLVRSVLENQKTLMLTQMNGALCVLMVLCQQSTLQSQAACTHQLKGNLPN